jgi:hypothetical protein
MKTTQINPVEKFKYLLKGSVMARNLTFLYVLVSVILAFKMRAQIIYVVPLVFGALLMLWYGLTYLSLKNINLKKNDLSDQFLLYKARLFKREKYESTVIFIWSLTIIPAILEGAEITIFTVLIYMVAIYIVLVGGNSLFKKVKKELKDLELIINLNEVNKL